MEVNELFLLMAIDTILNWHDEEHHVMWDPFYDMYGREIMATPNEATLYEF